MRNLIIFVGCNVFAIMVLCGRPTIKNKIFFYCIPIIVMVTAFLDFYMHMPWWRLAGYDRCNFYVLCLSSAIMLAFRYQQNHRGKGSNEVSVSEDIKLHGDSFEKELKKENKWTR